MESTLKLARQYALSRGDEALGELLDALESGGRADSTLFVIMGDHGEAFGQHGQRGHGANVYQENVRIPLILISSAVSQREVSDVVGGQIDIAPTVFDILGLPFPPLWQGSSLFAADRAPRSYFFATWTDLQFGYREGQMKFVFNATANRCRSVDLAADPEELRSDHAVDADSCNMIKERLAAWIQYQQNLLGKLHHGRD